MKRKHKTKKPYSLYALLLEDNYFYVGTSRNVPSRYDKHVLGKGALWTQRHRPVGIIEIRDLETKKMHVACLLEDQMTLEYAEMYGYNNVRGGGYCQQFPHWPK